MELKKMKDDEMIKNTCLNYVQGWYEADSKRMEKALYKDLVKRRFVSTDEIWSVSFDEMLKLTKDGQGKIEDPSKGKVDITILDKTEKIATVKVLSETFTDYLHLIKVEGGWKIFNVLWEYI